MNFLVSYVVSFGIGVLFSAWSNGFIVYLSILIIWEFVALACIISNLSLRDLLLYIGLIFASLAGYLFGRIIAGDPNPFAETRV